MVKQTCALTKITASTWGATFARARQVYSAVVRPAMGYGSIVWHSPTGTKDARKNTVAKMEVMQNKCLRTIAGAYRATPVEVLQAETLIPPIKEYLNQRQASARSRLKIGGQAAFIRKQCKKIKAKLRHRNSRLGTEWLPDTPESQKTEWALPIMEGIAHTLAPACPPPWIDEDENYLKQAERFRALQRQRKKAIKKHFADKWQSSWSTYQEKHDRYPTTAQTAPLHRKERLDLHANLAKAESSLAVQIGTEKIGFAQFLHRQHVPAVTSPACDCGWHSQTAKHVIRHCNIRPYRRRMLDTTDYRSLVTTPKRPESKSPSGLMRSVPAVRKFSLASEQLLSNDRGVP